MPYERYYAKSSLYATKMADRHAHYVSAVWRDAGDRAHDAGTVKHYIRGAEESWQARRDRGNWAFVPGVAHGNPTLPWLTGA
jgi:hypothetical protein